MKNIFALIREHTGLTQEEFAGLLGVSFTAVNRWENDRSVPENKVQDRIYDFAIGKGIDVAQLISDRIRAEYQALPKEPLFGMFFHGSKSGIEGPIKPCSRANCDFGPGFYMSTEVLSPLTLVCDNDDMKFYIVSMYMGKANIRMLEPCLDWAMTIAYCRGKLNRIKGTALYKKYEHMLDDKNIAIGYIADDKMYIVLKNFFEGNITDVALIDSLRALNLGLQVVALTQEICDGIKIEKEIKLTYLEKKVAKIKSQENRKLGVALSDKICQENRREGKYFDEILKEA